MESIDVALLEAIIAGGGIATYLTQAVKRIFTKAPGKVLAGVVSVAVSIVSILMLGLPIEWNSVPDILAVLVGTISVASGFYNNWVNPERSE